LHFCFAHPASAAVIPGASRPERIVEDHSAMNERVPAEFWHALRKEALVSPIAPLPIDRKRDDAGSVKNTSRAGKH
jgi:D-threo-aldose 1-dehydrogenase